jgi:hypothetical protein
VAGASRPAIPIGTAAIARFRGLCAGKRGGEDNREGGCSSETSFTHESSPFAHERDRWNDRIANGRFIAAIRAGIFEP